MFLPHHEPDSSRRGSRGSLDTKNVQTNIKEKTTPVYPVGSSDSDSLRNSSPNSIPSLELLVCNTVPAKLEFSQRHFLEYLHKIHCAENLMYIVDVNHFLRKPSLPGWQHIYDRYFLSDSHDELNLPFALKEHLTRDLVPALDLLVASQKFIHDDILVNLYNEFVRYVRNKQSEAHTWTYPVLGAFFLPDIIESDSDDDAALFSLRKPSTLSSGTGSRGLSIGLIMDLFKLNVDYSKFKMKFRRRFSNEH